MEQLQLSGKVLAFCLVFSTARRRLDTVTAHPFLWAQELARIDRSAELLGSLKDVKSTYSFRVRRSEITHTKIHVNGAVSCIWHTGP